MQGNSLVWWLISAALLACTAPAPVPPRDLAREAELERQLQARIAAVEAEVPLLDGGGPPRPLSEGQRTRFVDAWNAFRDVAGEVDGLYHGPPGTTPEAIQRLQLRADRLCASAGAVLLRQCPAGPGVKDLAGVLAQNIQLSRQRQAELEGVRGLYDLAHLGPGFVPAACPDGSRARPRDALGRGGCRFAFQLEGIDSRGEPSGDAPMPGAPFIATAYGVAAPVTGVRYRMSAKEGLDRGLLLERLGGREPVLLSLPRPAAGAADVGAGAPGVPAFEPELTRPVRIGGYDPVYTVQALEARTQGLIIVKCIIDTAGNVDDCMVIKPLPDMEMSVLGAVTSRRYQPVTYRGKPITCDYVFNIKLVFPQLR